MNYNAKERLQKVMLEPPIQTYRKIFCHNCTDKKYCQINRQQMHACILIKIADELSKIRQLKQREIQAR